MMRIRIVRHTLAAPIGQVPRPVDAGETIDVNALQGQQLLAMGKAVAVDFGANPGAPAPHLVGIEHAIDTNVITAERRVFGGMLLSGIDGIGPRTAERLASAGLETVDDLLAADPAAVQAATGASPATITKWRQRAEAATQ